MTIKEYLRDVTTLTGRATVIEVQPDRQVVRLRTTWFHPQGGGQKADRGEIGGCKVIHVAHNGLDVDHFLESVTGLAVGSEYGFRVDEEWRRLNAIYHTAGHLVAGVVETTYPKFKAIAGHQWPGEGRVEFEAGSEEVTPEQFRLVVQGQLKISLAQALPVSVVGEPFSNRAIKIQGFEAISCGGTHVQSLREIHSVNITAVKRKAGRLRVSYEAFGYAYDYMP